MFDKANMQQRLAALERAIDGLGHNLKPEIAQIREELSYVRLMLEDVMHEVRALNGHADSNASSAKLLSKKKSA